MRRIERVAERLVARAKRRLVEKIDVPGVEVEETERGVRLSGRGLLRRVLTDARLRWIGGLLK